MTITSGVYPSHIHRGDYLWVVWSVNGDGSLTPLETGCEDSEAAAGRAALACIEAIESRYGDEAPTVEYQEAAA